MSGRAVDHYRRIAASYDQNWAYSPEFIEAMSEAIIGTAEISADDLVVDLGGGTGLYAREFARRVALTRPVYCVDPSPEMLEQAPSEADIVTVQASAEDLVSGQTTGLPGQFDVVVIKEAIHHVDDRKSVIRGLAGMLKPGGRLLIAMLPLCIEYPLFDGALRRYAELQPDPAEIASAMRDSSLEVTSTRFEFPLEFPAERYFQMVRARYMSLLSLFSDEQIESGIQEIMVKYHQDRFAFPDRFEFVLGKRAVL